MKAEWYRKDQLLAFHAHRRCWKRSSIAHRAERQAIERGIPAAAGQLDGNQRAVSPDDEADRCDPVEVDPRGLARGYSRPELALIGRKRGLFLIILGLRRRDLGFRRGRSAYRRDSERRGDCWSSGYRRRSWSASFSRRSQLGRVRRAPLRR